MDPQPPSPAPHEVTDDLVDLLARCPAFAGVERPALVSLVRGASLAYVAAGAAAPDLVGPLVVQRGALLVRDPSGRTVDLVAAGEYHRRGADEILSAQEGTLVVVLPDAAADLAWSRATARPAPVPSVRDVDLQTAPVRTLVGRDLVTARADEPCRAVAERMRAHASSAAPSTPPTCSPRRSRRHATTGLLRPDRPAGGPPPPAAGLPRPARRRPRRRARGHLRPQARGAAPDRRPRPAPHPRARRPRGRHRRSAARRRRGGTAVDRPRGHPRRRPRSRPRRPPRPPPRPARGGSAGRRPRRPGDVARARAVAAQGDVQGGPDRPGERRAALPPRRGDVARAPPVADRSRRGAHRLARLPPPRRRLRGHRRRPAAGPGRCRWGGCPVEGGRARLAGAGYLPIAPAGPVPTASMAFHGLLAEDLAGAPSAEAVGARLGGALDGRLLVAHGAALEVGPLARCGVAVARRDVVDTMPLAAALDRLDGRGVVRDRRLTATALRLGVPVHRAHHAFGDALTTAGLFRALAAGLEAHGAATRGDLVRLGTSR